MGGDLTLYITGDAIPGYLSAPDSGGPWPGVVVLHQAFGLDDDIRRITDRVASMGYLAVAPDLIDGGGWRCIARMARDLWRGAGDNVEKVEALTTWLNARADCSGKVGAIGFCMGGGYAFLLGARQRVDVTAPNYGQIPDDLANSCPVVASYGAEDKMLRRKAQAARASLTKAGIDNDFRIYPGAGHSFMNQTEGHRVIATLGRPLLAVGYRREAAEDAWNRIETFFGRYLNDGRPPQQA